MQDRDQYDVPFLPAESIPADRLLPQEDTFRWNEYHFVIRPFPGQTWWHCAFDARIDSRHVLFSGDNFQLPTRWNGTGGFCAFNGSRFSEGFARSAQTVLDIAPEIICNGHLDAEYFSRQRVEDWRCGRYYEAFFDRNSALLLAVRESFTPTEQEWYRKARRRGYPNTPPYGPPSSTATSP